MKYITNNGILSMLEELGYKYTMCNIYYPEFAESYNGYNITLHNEN